MNFFLTLDIIVSSLIATVIDNIINEISLFLIELSIIPIILGFAPVALAVLFVAYDFISDPIFSE